MEGTLDGLPATRVEYGNSSFDLSTVGQRTPLEVFSQWYAEAQDAIAEPNAMLLATCDDQGPAARIVLLKTLTEAGFVFYTNYDSAKGEQLAANPAAALTFPWHDMHRQVRVRGSVEKTSAAESDDYFASRTRGSQLGAHASAQSREVASRGELEAEFANCEARFADQPVPRPANWGGYRVAVYEIEFWQGRGNRFHDRLVFRARDGQPADLADAAAWQLVRLQP